MGEAFPGLPCGLLPAGPRTERPAPALARALGATEVRAEAEGLAGHGALPPALSPDLVFRDRDSSFEVNGPPASRVERNLENACCF